MRTKKILISSTLILILINLPLLVYIYTKFTRDIIPPKSFDLIFVIAISSIFLLIGQWLRMLRTKIIIDQVRVGGVRGHFAALSVGYFFNSFLPFRLGELLRSYLISSRLQISFLYTLMAVVIERSFDLLFVCLVALLIAASVSTNISTLIFISALGGIIVSLIVLLTLWLLAKENKQLLSVTWTITSLFNKKIQNSYRFKIWSLIYGLQKFIANKRSVLKYIILAFLSWVSLLISTGIIALYYFGDIGLARLVLLASEPYVAVNSLWGSIREDIFTSNALSVLSTNFDIILLKDFLIVTWCVLIMPMALIGFISIFIFDWKRKKQSKPQQDIISYSNKLSRQFDLSQEFPAFLDSYFKGNSLSKILHKIEIDGSVSLVKFFKGGSDAVTFLAIKDDHLYVKKIVSAEFAPRLRQQYNWLVKYNSKNIVKVVDQDKTKLYYSIDLEYSPKNVSFFEYMHSRSLPEAKKIIDDTWSLAFKKIYTQINKEKKHNNKFKDYLEDRLINKVESAAKINNSLNEILRYKEIFINGERYYNLFNILDKIKNNKQCWNELITYRETDAAHGDLTIDNIMVNIVSNSPYIIDPSDDNQVRGPVLDFGRHMQSLSYGYEFLCGDDSKVDYNIVNGKPVVQYNDHKSARYMQLDEYVKNEVMPKYLTSTEINSVEFHVALFYGRMLTHRVIINPDNVIKFYATSVIGFNKYFNKYQ